MKSPKKRNIIKGALCLGLSAFLFASCSERKFSIKGEISGGDKELLTLEKSDFGGQWIVIDSLRLGSDGKFDISFPSPVAPDIYRLALDGRYIYLPVDSTETINVTSSADGFGRDFTLSGSSNAELMEKFEKEILGLPKGAEPDSLADFKKKIFTNYMKDSQGSILSFYILTKTINGKPLYNPGNPTDVKYFGAVATGFKTLRPDDPHTRLLEETAINSLKKRNTDQGRFRQIEAEELSLIDIEMPDEKGRMVKLSDIAGKGKPVVVIFSVLTHHDSPALNYELAQIYNRHKGNVEFYNVSVDADQYEWREAAVNLPWITVFSPTGINSETMINYNVVELPAYYVYDSQGNLISRPASLKELESNLK